MLQLTDISKSFGSHTLFSGVTYRLQQGDRVGLVGVNGAGKTTLLKIIAGQESADHGSVTPDRGVQIGYLAQEHDTDTQVSVLAYVLRDPPDPDDHSYAGRAHQILTGLGFSGAQMEAPIAQLSGGFVMRVRLARLLLHRPSLLLLDEPNNHLDLESMTWLEGFLSNYPGAWVVVSHDRYFLNRTVASVAELTPNGLWVCPGNYDEYLEAREALQAQLDKMTAEHGKRVQEIQQFVTRFRAKASKAKQAQSRMKLLEKMEADHQEQLKQTRVESASRGEMHMHLPEPPRSGESVVQLKDGCKRFGDKVLYDKLNLQVYRGDRIALLGQNGAGKSTLLKILAQRLSLDSGQLLLGHQVYPYYFAQHQTDVLDASKTVLETLWTLMPKAPESRVRGILGAFLFPGDDVHKKVSVLSGGEKSRLVLATMLAQPVNFLLLDEPTNHLDLASRNILEYALSQFSGAMVIISHDRYFINRIATKIVHIDHGRTTEYAGDFDYFLWKQHQGHGDPDPNEEDHDGGASARRSKDGNHRTLSANDASSTRHAEERASNAAAEWRDRKTAQRETAKRIKEAARLEADIQTSEARIKAIDEQLCLVEVFSDATKCRHLMGEREELQERVEALYAAWSATTETLEP